MNERIHDLVGIGLGPFNLSLACLAEPVRELDSLFLDENSHFDWHPGLMLDDARLQTPFLSDLVTLADPTSPYSFLNYIKEQGRIHSFYIRENFFLLRREYNQYCRWAAERLANVRFNQRVTWVDYDEQAGLYRLRMRDTRSGEQHSVAARKLVVGTGPSPAVPRCCQGLDGPVVHAGQYLNHREALKRHGDITVVGSGQSAAEVFHDLLRDMERGGYGLRWITRSARFFPLEYTKLTLEMTSPEYVDYFFALPAEKRDELLGRQQQLYKGINSDLINEIHDLLYAMRLRGEPDVRLLTNTRLIDARREASGRYTLRFHHDEQGCDFRQTTGALVLATGYHYRPPACLKGIAGRIRWDEWDRYDVRRNYSIDRNDNEIFVQNGPLHTHGFVTPDLGMACYRNALILREVTGREPYAIETRTTFQHFGVPDELMADLERESA